MANPTTEYATAADVGFFLLIPGVIGQNSPVSEGTIERYIRMGQAEYEQRSKTAFRPRLVTDEMHDLEAVEPRYQDTFARHSEFAYRPVLFDHGPILPFNAARGHKLEVYEGSEQATSTIIPFGEWDTDYVADKTYGRLNDWWVDHQARTLYFRKTFLYRRSRLMRATYEYGHPITTLNGSLAAGATTVTVASTWRYETRGYIRVGREWIHHTGKTTTTFTGCTRGAHDTQDIAHSNGDEVYGIPDEVWTTVVKMAAVKMLQNERAVAQLVEGASGLSTREHIEMLREEIDEVLPSGWGLI